MNLFPIAPWWLTGGPGSFPWCIIVLFFRGIGLAANYISAVHGGAYTERMAEKEYHRLKGER